MKHHRKDIIAKGQELIRKNGYHATGVAEILTDCGISKGTFYNYFENKEDFALACLKNYSSQIKKLIDTYMSFTSQQPSKRLFRYFEQLIKINQKEGAENGCLLMNLATEMGGNSHAISHCARVEFDDWIHLLVPTIEQAQKQGELTDNISANVMARMIYYEIFGGFVEMKATQSTNRMQHQLENLFRLLRV